MKNILLLLLFISLNIFAANSTKLSTPYWQFIYKGNGTAFIQENVLFRPDFILEPVSSNINGWAFNTYATNLPVLGIADIPPVILWILNDDGNGKLLVKSNTKQNKISAQLFSVVCSNSSLKKISVKVNKKSLVYGSKPLSGLVKDLFLGEYVFSQCIFADGNIGSININSDIYGTLLYAKNFNTIKLKNATYTSIFAGTPTKIKDGVVTGSTTNNNVVFMSSGSIGKIIAKRLENTVVAVGTALISCPMDEADDFYSSAELQPTGTIGLVKAKELAGWGIKNDYDNKWYLSKELILNRNGLILASEIKKLKIKTLTTENTSVYIFGN